jgi:hypothetical protein
MGGYGELGVHGESVAKSRLALKMEAHDDNYLRHGRLYARNDTSSHQRNSKPAVTIRTMYTFGENFLEHLWRLFAIEGVGIRK